MESTITLLETATEITTIEERMEMTWDYLEWITKDKAEDREDISECKEEFGRCVKNIVGHGK